MLLTVMWFFIVVGTFVAIDAFYPNSLYMPDKAVAAAFAWRLIALSFGLSAVSVLVASRHRSRQRAKPADPFAKEPRPAQQPDEFMWIALRFWPYILGACSLAALAWSFFCGPFN